MNTSEYVYKTCALCSEPVDPVHPAQFGQVRGNVEPYLKQEFLLWQCPRCQTLHSLESVDYAEIYAHYPLNERRLDVFARGTLGNLLKRLKKHGLQKHDRILDYGCGNGLLVEFLQSRGYKNVSGWDPYLPDWQQRPGESFDWVIANDVIEHVDDPRALLQDCLHLLSSGGHLYVGTADAGGVTNMANLEPHIMRLHQPYHRIILTQAGLLRLGEETGLVAVASWKRSYMDRLVPFSNYRFLDEFNRAHSHDMNQALSSEASQIMWSHPSLWFWAFFGYFFPSAYEPAVIWQMPG